MTNLFFVQVVDLASTIDLVDAKLAVAIKRGDLVEISKLELILLNMRNLQRPKLINLGKLSDAQK